MNRDTSKIEWLTCGLIAGCYGVFVLGLLAWAHGFWWLALPLLAVMAAFHMSLQHETIHGHPTAQPWINELLVSLPLAAIFPYRRYKTLHLQHHRDEHLTDPLEDPESYFWKSDDVKGMRRWVRGLFAVNNTFVGRIVIGPALTIIGLIRTEIPRLRHNEPNVRIAWVLHLLGLACLALILSQAELSLWIYVTCVVYPALSLTAVRSYAEHQAAENVGARSAIVETHPILALLYLNNNLHIVHHASPATAWYDVPALYRERRAQYLAANENTLFHGYGDIMRRFAFSPKQPLAHPLLHRQINSPALHRNRNQDSL